MIYTTSMSRAFTKEDDAGDEFHEKPVPPGPNYVTPRGLELLKAQAQELLERRKTAADKRPLDRDLRYLDTRLSTALVVPPGQGDEVRFGARVTLRDENGCERRLRLVGEDEARGDDALLAWSSPLALALIGKKAGEAADWDGPQQEITAVEY